MKFAAVVLQGGADLMVGGTEKRWSLAFLKEVGGAKLVQPKRRVDDSAAWAGLEQCAEVAISIQIVEICIQNDGFCTKHDGFLHFK